MTTMSLEDQWIELFQKNEDVYIFGAGSVGKILIKMVRKYGFDEKLRGILVSDTAGNPEEIDGIPVLELASEDQKEALVLIGTSMKFQAEVEESLNQLGWTNRENGFRFVHLLDRLSEIDDERRKRIDALKAEPVCAENLVAILKNLLGSDQQFGSGGFYQSLPKLGIEGTRPSDVRIREYGILDYVRGKSVLDIGSNSGFFDLTLAEYAASITGVEYSRSLVEIAEETADYLKLENVRFVQADFTRYEDAKQYDVILFLAVHGWIPFTPEEGTEKIINLMSPSGVLLFESQNWDMGDPLYSKYCKAFLEGGLKVVSEGFITDDGETRRKWTILQKQ